MRYPGEIEARIRQRIVAGDLVSARAATDRLIRELDRGEGLDRTVLMQLLHDCAARVRRSVNRIFGPGCALPSRLELARRLSVARSPERLLAEFEYVVHEMLDAAEKIDRRSASVAERARSFIHEHFHDDITTGSVARAVACSEPHLCVAFRRAHGVTVGQYIRRRRIELAKSLLASTRLQVKSIAHQVGFNTYRTFLRSFHDQAGETPTDYRRASRSGR